MTVSSCFTDFGGGVGAGDGGCSDGVGGVIDGDGVVGGSVAVWRWCWYWCRGVLCGGDGVVCDPPPPSFPLLGVPRNSLVVTARKRRCPRAENC